MSCPITELVVFLNLRPRERNNISSEKAPLNNIRKTIFNIYAYIKIKAIFADTATHNFIFDQNGMLHNHFLVVRQVHINVIMGSKKTKKQKQNLSMVSQCSGSEISVQNQNRIHLPYEILFLLNRMNYCSLYTISILKNPCCKKSE